MADGPLQERRAVTGTADGGAAGEAGAASSSSDEDSRR